MSTNGLPQIARVLMGTIYTLNGLNWWYKIITPYPSLSDFAHFYPPPDVVGAMIENGILFHMVKATELLTGVVLLSNRWVPLMLVLAMPVTVPVFVVDAFWHPHLRGVLMGTGSLLLNGFLLLTFFGHYRTLLTVHSAPSMDPGAPAPVDDALPGGQLASMARPLMPVLGALACAVGAVMVTWLLVMIVQYILNPLPLSALHPLQPR